MLGKPQIPTPPQLQAVSNWGSLATNFTQVTSYLQNLVRYLQQYLGTTYNAIAPLQFATVNIVQAQSPYGVQATDVLINASASASAATEVDLPASTGSGRALIVIKVDANAENINVTPNGSDTINGGGAVALASQYNLVRLVDGQSGNWLEW